MKYKRDINEKFLQIFLKGEPLNFLIDYKDLDFQIRANKNTPHGWISLYEGLTKIIDIKYYVRKHVVKFQAHKTYRDQVPHSLLFNEDGFDGKGLYGIEEKFLEYETTVERSPRHIKKEGEVQQAISFQFGKNYNTSELCLAIDREVLIGYKDQTEKDKKLKPENEIFLGIAKELSDTEPHIFGTGLGTKSFGNELDLIGLNAENKLFLIEVKPDDTMGIYRSPLQIGLYTKLWQKLREEKENETIQNINRIIDQKEKLGLVPETGIRLEKGFKIIPCLIIAGTPTSNEVYPRLKHFLNKVNENTEDCLKNFKVFEHHGKKLNDCSDKLK